VSVIARRDLMPYGSTDSSMSIATSRAPDNLRAARRRPVGQQRMTAISSTGAAACQRSGSSRRAGEQAGEAAHRRAEPTDTSTPK
jgi:hypothetical protein